MSLKRWSFGVSKVLAAAVLMGATAAYAQAPETKPAPRDPNQSTARKTGNAVTDSWITMKVHSQFVPEDALEGSDINVDTNAGVVTLKGTVRTAAGRDRAIAIAKATDGVKSVNNQLTIAPAERTADAAREAGAKAGETAKGTAGSAGRTVTDGWIKSKIYSQYLTEDALDDSDVNIDVTKGNVVLKGVVRSEAGKARAAAIAKGTDGVKNVTNNLKVTPKTN